jgi:hypothetical protein
MTVNTEDTVIPSSLQPVINELNQILKIGMGPEQPLNPFANMPT